MKRKNLFILPVLISIFILFFLFVLLNLQGSVGYAAELSIPDSLTSTPTQDKVLGYKSQVATITPTDDTAPMPTASPTETSPVGQAFTLTQSLIVTATNTSTPTITATGTITPTPGPISYSLLPFLVNVHEIPVITPSPIETLLLCSDPGLAIPDNDPGGVNDEISISENRLLVGLSLYLDISHGAVGDLTIKLTNQTLNKTITVLNNPGNQTNRCYENDIITILDDAAIQPVNDQCAPDAPAISGIYLPTQNLGDMTGLIPSGNWRLNVADGASLNTGRLNNWCMVAKVSNLLPQPTATPPPVSLPSNAFVSGMTGQNQYFNLDCESRSAVDWANHFGVSIDELDFFYNLPRSNDDPEVGFVGAPNGRWGNIPPDDYGVHAAPVADLLNDYGVTASARQFIPWDTLRAEIASGNPVITWIIGDYSANIVNGIPHPYIPASGNYTVVAPYEHTVVVIGYSPTEVKVLNGSRIISVPLDQFLDSWSVLQFMGVVAGH